MSVYLFEAIFMIACFAIDAIMFFKIKKISFKSSILIFIFWTLVSLAFFTVIYTGFSKTMATEFLTGYILERTLGLDNMFVFILLFASFKVPAEGKERILFWGIVGAILLSILFIYLGAALIATFSFVMYIFGFFLVLTGLKLLVKKEEKDLKDSKIIKFFQNIIPSTKQYEGDKFYIKQKGRALFTPLFLVLLFVAVVDIIFAIDSIPAIFGITKDPFVVVTANFFSLMGFRAMFFLVSHLMNYFYYTQKK